MPKQETDGGTLLKGLFYRCSQKVGNTCMVLKYSRQMWWTVCDFVPDSQQEDCSIWNQSREGYRRSPQQCWHILLCGLRANSEQLWTGGIQVTKLASLSPPPSSFLGRNHGRRWWQALVSSRQTVLGVHGARWGSKWKWENFPRN